MKYPAVFLILCLLFSGCSAAAPAPTDSSISDLVPESIASTVVPETAAPTDPTVPETQPPSQLDILIADMTTEEKVGQLFLARCPDANAIEDISTYHLGGYILFAKDFQNETPESIQQTIAAYQDASPIALLIAVDEEGGTVTRISSNTAFRSERFASPRKLYASGGLDALLEAEKEKCSLLSSLGINVNMAPVCDITTDSSAFMYRRSLGLSPEETGNVISEMVRTMNDGGIGSVLKHFPGYGNNSDTHTAIAVDSRTLEELESYDLFPFRAGIEAGCGAVLVSHTIVEALDSELPASLSPQAHQYLREKMGFFGVIITDDLVMQAVTDAYGAGEAAVLAVLAGNDLLCSTEYAVQYEAVLAAVNDGRISADLLDSAVRRVLQWKMNLNII